MTPYVTAGAGAATYEAAGAWCLMVVGATEVPLYVTVAGAGAETNVLVDAAADGDSGEDITADWWITLGAMGIG